MTKYSEFKKEHKDRQLGIRASIEDSIKAICTHADGGLGVLNDKQIKAFETYADSKAGRPLPETKHPADDSVAVESAYRAAERAVIEKVKAEFSKRLINSPPYQKELSKQPTHDNESRSPGSARSIRESKREILERARIKRRNAIRELRKLDEQTAANESRELVRRSVPSDRRRALGLGSSRSEIERSNVVETKPALWRRMLGHGPLRFLRYPRGQWQKTQDRASSQERIWSSLAAKKDPGAVQAKITRDALKTELDTERSQSMSAQMWLLEAELRAEMEQQFTAYKYAVLRIVEQQQLKFSIVLALQLGITVTPAEWEAAERLGISLEELASELKTTAKELEAVKSNPVSRQLSANELPDYVLSDVKAYYAAAEAVKNDHKRAQAIAEVQRYVIDQYNTALYNVSLNLQKHIPEAILENIKEKPKKKWIAAAIGLGLGTFAAMLFLGPIALYLAPALFGLAAAAAYKGNPNKVGFWRKFGQTANVIASTGMGLITMSSFLSLKMWAGVSLAAAFAGNPISIMLLVSGLAIFAAGAYINHYICKEILPNMLVNLYRGKFGYYEVNGQPVFEFEDPYGVRRTVRTNPEGKQVYRVYNERGFIVERLYSPKFIQVDNKFHHVFYESTDPRDSASKLNYYYLDDNNEKCNLTPLQLSQLEDTRLLVRKRFEPGRKVAMYSGYVFGGAAGLIFGALAVKSALGVGSAFGYTLTAAALMTPVGIAVLTAAAAIGLFVSFWIGGLLSNAIRSIAQTPDVWLAIKKFFSDLANPDLHKAKKPKGVDEKQFAKSLKVGRAIAIGLMAIMIPFAVFGLAMTTLAGQMSLQKGITSFIPALTTKLAHAISMAIAFGIAFTGKTTFVVKQAAETMAKACQNLSMAFVKPNKLSRFGSWISKPKNLFGVTWGGALLGTSIATAIGAFGLLTAPVCVGLGLAYLGTILVAGRSMRLTNAIGNGAICFVAAMSLALGPAGLIALAAFAGLAGLFNSYAAAEKAPPPAPPGALNKDIQATTNGSTLDITRSTCAKQASDLSPRGSHEDYKNAVLLDSDEFSHVRLPFALSSVKRSQIDAKVLPYMSKRSDAESAAAVAEVISQPSTSI